jgi:hypothetical protein
MLILNFQAILTSLPRAGDPLGFAGTWREAAVRRGLLPVYSDWECCYAITKDAEPVYSEDTEWGVIRPLTNSRHRFVVLAQAAERFPELAHLRPTRAASDPTCPTCRGSGRVPIEADPTDTIICECGGLGWFPSGSVLGP